MSGNSSMRRRHKVVLPAPDGDDTTINSPCGFGSLTATPRSALARGTARAPTPWPGHVPVPPPSATPPEPPPTARSSRASETCPPSFHVLHLLAEPLELRLHLDDLGSDLRRLCLAADGVHLAMDLLRQEVELAADGRARRDEAMGLGEV